MITGGVKFFDVNAAGLSAGGTIVDLLGTGSSVVNNLIGKSRYTYWSTVGSNDNTTETLTLTFPTYTLNRILVVGHNWKQFTCQYWNGSAFVDFSQIVGADVNLQTEDGNTLDTEDGQHLLLQNLGGAISETDFSDSSSQDDLLTEDGTYLDTEDGNRFAREISGGSTAYYEVADVTTTQVQFTITKTQTPGAEKTAVFIIITSELGTLQGFPGIKPAKVSRNVRQMNMPSGKQKIVKAPESYDCILDFSPYAAGKTYQPDLDLMYELHDRDTPFLMWPCGGRNGRKYFKYPIRLMRLQDIFLAQLVTDISGLYPSSNIYTGPVDLGQLEFVEHV